MGTVRTFSRVFPPGHFRAGEKTLFVEKILRGLDVDYAHQDYLDRLLSLNARHIDKQTNDPARLSFEDIESFWLSLQPTTETKVQTIRKGLSLQAGKTISPRVWWARPRRSPQITFWDDLLLVRCPTFHQDAQGAWLVDSKKLSEAERIDLSIRDGFKYPDMLEWFKGEISGQVLCWG